MSSDVREAAGEVSFWILVSLSDTPKHGYGVLRDVELLSASGGGRTVSLKVPTLYAALERLERADLIEVDREEVVEGRARRYYCLTSAGAVALADETSQLEVRARAAREALARAADHRRTPDMASR
ncbi:PadR family transcriptional regulator [Microbacterium kyungheense]|uniref:DNA-binding PadR family transcriptional regulator n=1 Tax=Microbacterium kyungheense TaxID=1263636 RepID=A0A543EFP4_9MICO|nr:PadR family transcriptional regulator [Microbacterium kyungheense]TQM20329.1 DNA-binding PadR family transcriptional regulator [Microbacterium kyungheense]